MKIASAYRSNIGRVRKENQDAVGYYPGHPLFVVADGMGGHAGGRQASETAIETIYRCVADAPTQQVSTDGDDDTTPILRSILVQAIHKANRSIVEKAQGDENLQGMGTTVVAMLFEGDGIATVAHVGDSRAYRLRKGGFERLTADHSLVADLVRKGEISEAEAERHPYRHTLTKALGQTDEPEPDVKIVELQVGDLYVLCSDGIYGMISEQEIAEIVERTRDDLDEACDRLVAAANAAGGKDNSSVVVIRCDP